MRTYREESLFFDVEDYDGKQGSSKNRAHTRNYQNGAKNLGQISNVHAQSHDELFVNGIHICGDAIKIVVV